MKFGTGVQNWYFEAICIDFLKILDVCSWGCGRGAKVVYHPVYCIQKPPYSENQSGVFTINLKKCIIMEKYGQISPRIEYKQATYLHQKHLLSSRYHSPSPLGTRITKVSLNSWGMVKKLRNCASVSKR